tara:strand:+ start:156 stop:530 length:375 start_codon:yes stop_codon:yes gene_type:complete
MHVVYDEGLVELFDEGIVLAHQEWGAVDDGPDAFVKLSRGVLHVQFHKTSEQVKRPSPRVVLYVIVVDVVRIVQNGFYFGDENLGVGLHKIIEYTVEVFVVTGGHSSLRGLIKHGKKPLNVKSA